MRTRATKDGPVPFTPAEEAEADAEELLYNSSAARKERLKLKLKEECVSRIRVANEHITRKPVIAMQAAKAGSLPIINSNSLQADIINYMRDCSLNEAAHSLAIDGLADSSIDSYDITVGWPL